MRHIIFSLFAIALAAFAAIAATTAMLNAPVRTSGRRRRRTTARVSTPPAPPPAPPPGDNPHRPSPANPRRRRRTHRQSDAGQPGAAAADGKEDETADKDPYEGIAPEELPPDLQYSADSSVSFPDQHLTTD